MQAEDTNCSSPVSDCTLQTLRGTTSIPSTTMTTSTVRIPISSSSFTIHSSSRSQRPSVVTSSSRFPPVVIMGDRGRLSAFGMERSNVSNSSRSSGYGDEGNEQGNRMMEQEGMLPGGAPFLTADGLQTTINGMSKWIVSVLFCSVVLLKHDAEALWMVLGSVFNVTLSVRLKRVINQERPVANLRSDPGMPSSHAQSISFIITFAIVSLIEWIGLNEASLTISGILLALGVYMSWLRVSQQLHTTDQVIVGGLVGAMSFLFWYVLWRAVISRAFDSFLVVRVLLFLGTACCCVAFIVYAIRNWLNHER